MPTIIKIGYQDYLVKNDSAALAAIKALTGAVKLRSRHLKIDGDYREYYWPDEDRHTKVAIEAVAWNQILRSAPADTEVSSPAEIRALQVNPKQKLLTA